MIFETVYQKPHVLSVLLSFLICENTENRSKNQTVKTCRFSNFIHLKKSICGIEIELSKLNLEGKPKKTFFCFILVPTKPFFYVSFGLTKIARYIGSTGKTKIFVVLLKKPFIVSGIKIRIFKKKTFFFISVSVLICSKNKTFLDSSKDSLTVLRFLFSKRCPFIKNLNFIGKKAFLVAV